MPFCLLLTDPPPLDAERLKRAFRPLKSWTEADAVKLAADTTGILVKNLSLDNAQELQGALQAENVPATVVDAAELPLLPSVKALRWAEFLADALAIYDPLGRPSPLPYRDIALLSAGVVHSLGMTIKRTEQTQLAYGPIRGIHTKTVTDVRHQVENLSLMLVDIVVAPPTTRYQVEAGTFLFKYCFDQPDLDAAGKLGLLVRMLAERAPQATLNRGAAALRDGQPANAAYASKVALEDELVWRLWRARRRG